MFGIGPAELVIILIIALVVVGPERLPELARKLGQTISDVRRMYTNLRAELGPDFDEVEKQVRALRSLDPRRELDLVGRRMIDGLTQEIGPEAAELLQKPITNEMVQQTLRSEITPSATPAAPTASASSGTIPPAPPSAPVADVAATQQVVGRISHDLLNDALLDEPLADPAAPSSRTQA